MTSPRRTHAQARAEMAAGILREGRAQLDERGAASLSLREIARSLGVASSALYRHLADRDELLTLLLVDAYGDLADRVEAAVADVARAGGAPTAELLALGRSMRAWAVEHPRRWALLYGSPVPGYAAPAESTTDAGTRVMFRFLHLVSRGEGVATAAPSAELGALMGAVAEQQGLTASLATGADAIGAWTSLVGAISAEVFGQLGPELTPLAGELVERELARIARAFRLA